MSIPVKVSDELARAAKQVAQRANRSVTKQIEHWAELGRALEQLAPLRDLMAFKASVTNPSDAKANAEARAALSRLVVALAGVTDRSPALKRIRNTGKPVYGAAPGREDRVMQVWPDDRGVVGRLVGRKFVADAPSDAPGRKRKRADALRKNQGLVLRRSK